MRGRQTRRVERSPSVYPHLDVPVFDGCVGYRAMAHNSSSVDKNVEPAVGLNRATDERFDVFPRRHIREAGVGLVAVRAELSHRRVERSEERRVGKESKYK